MRQNDCECMYYKNDDNDGKNVNTNTVCNDLVATQLASFFNFYFVRVPVCLSLTIVYMTLQQ